MLELVLLGIAWAAIFGVSLCLTAAKLWEILKIRRQRDMDNANK